MVAALGIGTIGTILVIILVIVAILFFVRRRGTGAYANQILISPISPHFRVIR